MRFTKFSKIHHHPPKIDLSQDPSRLRRRHIPQGSFLDLQDLLGSHRVVFLDIRRKIVTGFRHNAVMSGFVKGSGRGSRLVDQWHFRLRHVEEASFVKALFLLMLSALMKLDVVGFRALFILLSFIHGSKPLIAILAHLPLNWVSGVVSGTSCKPLMRLGR